ncbi:hypothetical protein MRBBS_2407 [Marinobacter sp. BSs20148]|nr:hypothetical protein [Marinobacter sp. BSs20148]AFP31343.1 hypothetical protein MRBBS_2407 [Marinobacter sp. BSs20148]
MPDYTAAWWYVSRGLCRFGTALLLAIAYSASIGGIATLIGTHPNALLAVYLLDT